MMGRLATVKRNKKWAANVEALGEQVSVSTVQEIRTAHFDSMAAVVDQSDAMQSFTNRSGQHRKITAHIREHAVQGNSQRLKEAMALSDKLIDDAIVREPRLARRPQWTRNEDGIFADAGLVASGDDSPCYQMTRQSLRDQAAASEPVTVVISTDDGRTASVEAAGAFIAVVRLVQQFRPVHVWWQGAWLAEDGREAGYVLHAPLVSNDMDFARVEYVLADSTRDNLSFRALYMAAKVRDKLRTIAGLGRRADRAYMPNARFVDHGGIKPTAEQVASHACYWLGWESPWQRQYQTEIRAESALQELPGTIPADTRTETEKAKEAQRWADYRKRQEQETKSKARARAKAVQGSVMG